MDNRQKFHAVKKLRFDDNAMSIMIDGKEFSFALTDISARLSKASKKERETFRIDKYGYGIHWPLVDEDLSIDGLLGIKHRPVKAKKRIAVSSSQSLFVRKREEA